MQSQGLSREMLTAQRVLVRDMPDRSRIVATLRISQYGRNAHPHFSATANVYDAHGTHSGASRARRGLEADGGGCMHAAILDAFPGALPFVALHLADYPSGAPMHAEANAYYFLTGAAGPYDYEPYGAAKCARYLRIDDCRDLPYGLGVRPGAQVEDTEEHREIFARFVADQAPRWAREARSARELLELMPDVEQLRGYDMYGKPIERVALPSWLIGADAETVDV